MHVTCRAATAFNGSSDDFFLNCCAWVGNIAVLVKNGFAAGNPLPFMPEPSIVFLAFYCRFAQVFFLNGRTVLKLYDKTHALV